MDSKRPVILLLIFAAVSALLAGLVYQQLARGGTRGERHDVVAVLVAKQDLLPGTRITADMASAAFVRKDWPRELLPTDVVSVQNVDSVAGQIVRAAIFAGEPLYRFKLAAADSSAALPVSVADGMRAFTVPVDEVSGVGGYVLSGSYVDVIGTFRNVRESMFGRSRGETFSKVILERVKVLASGPQMEQNDLGSRSRGEGVNGRAAILARDRNAPTSATLLVSPVQAESLALAVKEGSIHLALRNYQDEGAAQTTGVTKEELLGLALPEPGFVPEGREPAPEPTGPQVEVIRGSERTSVSF